MDKKNTEDLLMLLATFRCFNEQLYNLKGTHSKIVKLKFNRLINVARAYENEVVKLTENNQQLEHIYDCLMDVILKIKERENEQICN